MKRLLMACTATVLLIGTGPVFAGEDAKSMRQPILFQNINQPAPATEYFRCKEWDLDVFGSYTQPTGQGRMHAGFGGGAGIDYFFNHYFGLGVEGQTFDSGPRTDTVNGGTGHLIARYPFEACHIAPYAFVGGGGTFMTHVDQGQVDGGLGIEWRATPHWGLFTDGRYVDTFKTNNYAYTRIGLRFAF